MAQAGQAASQLYSWMSPPSRSWRTIEPLGCGCRASAGGALHALEAAIAIRDRAAYAGLPVGIGIAVGPAIVGQLVAGSNLTAVGETTNLAARLQAQAQAGEILLSQEAYRRTGE